MKYFSDASNNGPVEAFYASFMPDVQRANKLENLIQPQDTWVLHYDKGWKSQPEQDPQTILGFNAVLQGTHRGWKLYFQVSIMWMCMHASADANMHARK